MRGPLQLLDKFTGFNPLESIRKSRNRCELRAIQAIGGLGMAAFVASGWVVGEGAYNVGMDMLNSKDGVTQVIDGAQMGGDGLFAGVFGWAAIEELALVVAAGRQIRYLEGSEHA